MPYGPDFIKQRAAIQLIFRPEGTHEHPIFQSLHLIFMS